MIANDLSPAEREFLIQLRSLLLKCVELIERRAELGKYKPSRELPTGPTDSIATAVPSEVKSDKLSSV